MTTVRAAKSKGSQFEYDVQHNLNHIYPDLIRTAERGFQMQFDLYSEKHNVAIECKRHAKLTYMHAKKYFEKLEKVAPEVRQYYLIFQNNRWPVLVMHRNVKDWIEIHEFKDYFHCENFEKHPSTRVRKEKK